MRNSSIKIIILGLFCTTLGFAKQNSEKITIPFYVPSGVTSEMSRLYNNIVRDFERNNPNIDVLFKPKNNYGGVLTEVLRITKNKKSAGVAIVELSELPTLVNKNAVIPYNGFLNKEPNILKTFIPKFLKNSYGNNGKIYGLPIFRSTPSIFYNMDMLKEAGIKHSDLPKNWKELKNILTILKNNNNQIPLYLAPEWYDWLFESFVFQSGGSLSNSNNTNVQFDHFATIEALSFWKELIDEKLMIKRSASWKSTINVFNSQKYPIIYYSTGGMGKLKSDANFNWTTTLMPKNKNYGTTVGAASIFLSNYMTKDEEKAAWKLVKYLESEPIQIKLSMKSGYLPVIKSAFENNKLKTRYETDQFKNIKKQLSYAYPKIMIPNYSQIRVVLKNAIDRSLDKGMDPEKSLKIAQKEAEKILNIK